MSHTPIHRQLLRTINNSQRRLSRRSFLLATAAAVPLAARVTPTVDVAIVGAGLAGLSCAWELKKAGVQARLYEAASRAGGRCFSLRNFFPGQVAERGGELIDNLHKTMLGYAKEFNLTLEDVGKQPGEVFYYLNGARVPETKVVEEYRAFVPAMRADLRRLSPQPTGDKHTPSDKELDNLTLRQYLETRRAGKIIGAAIEQAYTAEYGLSIDEQSCLNFLLFIHADRRSKFTPFGVFSDERYHIVEGNDAIATGLASRVQGQITTGKSLTRVRPSASGGVELSFADGSTATHGAVVLTLPFSVLRHVDLSEMPLTPDHHLAIQQLGYGDNAKMMIGFNKPAWRDLGCDGASYSDLPHHQSTWETNPTRASASRAILTDYSGAERGRNLNPNNPQGEAALFLGDLKLVMPGVPAHARKIGNNYQVHIEHWPSNPLSRGSYTCYKPGQFTTIAGNEGKPAGKNLFFAGEHTNSFYEWQGFMEGALLSGIKAAADILRRK